MCWLNACFPLQTVQVIDCFSGSSRQKIKQQIIFTGVDKTSGTFSSTPGSLLQAFYFSN